MTILKCTMQLPSRQIDLLSKSFRIHYMLIDVDLLSNKSLYPHNQGIPFHMKGCMKYLETYIIFKLSSHNSRYRMT